VISGTLVVDGERAISFLRITDVAGIECDRLRESALPGKDFPTLSEPAGLATLSLEDGGGFLRPDDGEPGLLSEEGAVDAPGGEGEEDDVVVEASLASAVSGEESPRGDDVMPGPYRFRDGGTIALPLLACGGPFLFFFFFFPSVKSGFLL